MIHPAALDIHLGRSDDTTLTWHVPRDEIVRQVKTISGIAKLALVDRQTVLRHGIAPNSTDAILFVRNRRRHVWKPLVSSSETLNWRNYTDRFAEVWNYIRALRRSKEQRQFDDKDVISVVDDSPSKPKLWNRKQRYHHDPARREITEGEREIFAKYAHYYDMPGEKISVAELCGILRLSRAAFGTWLKTLPLRYRQLLRNYMLRRPQPVPSPPGEDSKEEISIESDPFFIDREPETYGSESAEIDRPSEIW